ncbi:hypothetical protein BDD12DRAFT_804822 [Trichophaea hybrida]|nr:hypothetical protein BDD12DRAFT_804822 [Trichophaea hybrida]
MELLTDAGIAMLFEGAPHFALVPRADEELLAEDEYAFEPAVTFPFGGGVEGGAGDCRPPGHPAFTLCTSRNLDEEGMVKEVPSMGSFMGAEPGTCGLEYFLMLPVGDSDRDHDEGYDDEMDEGGRERGGGLRERGGVRSVEIGYIVDRLKELGSIWQTKKRERKERDEVQSSVEVMDQDEEEETEEEKDAPPTSVDMYTHLFTYVLFPPTRITTDDYLDPYSLKVQIMALIQTLAKKVWLDFSKVRWRIKLGQILWGDSIATGATEEEDGAEYEEWKASAKESERVWLLLQILLACELLVRIDSVLSDNENMDHRRASAQSNQSLPESKEQLLRRFYEAGGAKVQWDILLARRWLENIRIVEMDAKPPPPVENEREKSSFLAPPSRWFTFQQPSPEPSAPPTPDAQHITDALLLPRHPRRQIGGLLHFARKIRWPNVDALAQQAIARTSTTPASSVYDTPPLAGSPISMHSTNSYFPGPVPPRSKRLRELASDVPTLHKKKSSILTVPSDMGCGGWLSRSYLTGLILPGEGLSHLIMSTLLENDPVAVEVLGYNANLYGGLQYMGKTWWSRYCIVGRVMAGCEDVEEDCGWIGPVIGSGVIVDGEGNVMVGQIPDGWVDVVTSPPLDGKTPRALEPKMIEFCGDVRGKGWKQGTDLRRQQFVKAKDTAATAADKLVEARVEGLFFTLVEQQMEEDTDADFQSYDAAVHFLVGPQMGEKKLHILDLRYDVSFVAAWPCNSTGGGHLLHESFEYINLRIEELGEFRFEEAEEKVVVVDVWNPGQRVFVYAWCAQRGRSAIVATRGRSCSSCAIREAFAMRLGVVVVV